MIFQDHPMPYNMSAWNWPIPESDIYNATTGEYNITLPGAKMTANILLFATAYNSSTGYYGAFRNISLNYSNTTVPNFNFTLQTLLGTPTIISLNNASGGGPGGPPGTTNVTTNKRSFQLKNGTSTENITGFAHVEVQVNYSAYNGSTFNWMVDVSQSSNGSFSIPVINANINKINIFTQDFAPLKTSKTAGQLVSEPVVINLTSFNPGAINESGPSPNIFIDMLKSTSQCDVPNPAPGCSLFPAEINKSDFNPFRIVIGGGKISLRMRLVSNNITVHYKNVDMLASGPPDALFDPSANQSSQNGTALDQAWRFGSMGPEIYDEVLIGVPLDPAANASNVTVKIGKLYDDNWNVIWNQSAGNTTADLPSDYSDFNTTWFTTGTGMQCDTSNQNADCYVNTTERMVWLTIPHFSGVGPQVSSNTVGNVTVTFSNIAGINATMNFTVIDTANATSWYNITFPDSGFDATNAIVNITINGSADPLEWTKHKGTLFVNVSSSTVTANADVNQSINISNITAPLTPGNYIINVTTNNGVTVPVIYTVAVPITYSTSNPIRALNGTGIATKIPTNVYYYYNGSVIRVNVSLNQSGLNVSGDFSGVGNSSLINTSTPYQNASDEYIYTLTATAGDVGIEAYIVNITATNTTLNNSNTSTIPLIAVMNINPQATHLTLGGTNWTTEIADFTNATLYFEKFNDIAHTSRIGTLEFLDPMNLANTTTATALQNLGTNLNMAASSMSLNSTANALAAMNVSSRLTAYNLTNFTSGVVPGVFKDGVLIVSPNQTSGGTASGVNWDVTNYTLTFNVSGWSEYSWDGEPPAVYPQAVSPVTSGQQITLNATVIDMYSGVKNVTVNATNISISKASSINTGVILIRIS